MTNIEFEIFSIGNRTIMKASVRGKMGVVLGNGFADLKDSYEQAQLQAMASALKQVKVNAEALNEFVPQTQNNSQANNQSRLASDRQKLLMRRKNIHFSDNISADEASRKLDDFFGNRRDA